MTLSQGRSNRNKLKVSMRMNFALWSVTRLPTVCVLFTQFSRSSKVDRGSDGEVDSRKGREGGASEGNVQQRGGIRIFAFDLFVSFISLTFATLTFEGSRAGGAIVLSPDNNNARSASTYKKRKQK